jgi:hypothetical protein
MFKFIWNWKAFFHQNQKGKYFHSDALILEILIC